MQIKIPTTCPSCQTPLKLTETGIDLFCPNTENCPAQILGRLTYFCQRNVANITGLSEKNLEKFIKLFKIREIPDLYHLPYSEILTLEGFGEKSVQNLQTSIENSRQIENYKFLAGLGIDGIGQEVAKLICTVLPAEDEKETPLLF